MTFSTTRRVEFRDTDAAGIVHFSVFFPMMESAEHELLRSLGLSVLSKHAGGCDEAQDDSHVTWPRVAAHCDYVSVARFEDVLLIDVDVTKLGRSSVTYEFRFHRDGVSIARGELTAVACFLKPGGGGLQKTEIPDSVRNLLQRHVKP